MSGATRGPNPGAVAKGDGPSAGRALITGATGFIGGRLVEKLMLGQQSEVRALVSSYSRCARIARFPVEMFRGDLLDRNSVMRAAEGCQVVYHCAYGSRGNARERRAVNVEGTANVLEAARAAGARVVHLSSQMVYGVPAEGEISELSARQKTGSTYGDSKLEAEELVLEAAAEGLPATILQPTAVYGPYAPVWTVGVLERMRAGRVPLIDGGEGTCNAVYVDDVVDAMILAGSSDAAIGHCFLISAAQPTTWREFYGAYEAMLGVPSTVPLSVQEATAQAVAPPSLLHELPAILREEQALRSRLAATREGKQLARLYRALRPSPKSETVTPELDRLRRLRRSDEPSAPKLPASDVAFFASRARVSIEKARSTMGFEPRYRLRDGMNLTRAWASWAGLVPVHEGTVATMNEGVSQ